MTNRFYMLSMYMYMLSIQVAFMDIEILNKLKIYGFSEGKNIGKT